jgi:hypothetical protein
VWRIVIEKSNYTLTPYKKEKVMAQTLEVTLRNYPEEILNGIKELESSITALIAPPVRVTEVFSVIEHAGDILAKVQGITKPEALNTLVKIWEYFDEKYLIVQQLDDLIKLPAILEPFDSLAIRLLVRHVIIPATVGLLNLPE